MKTLAYLFVLLGSVLLSQAQYKPVPEGTSVKFKVKNFGFNTGGFFTGVNGTIQFDPGNPGAASFDVTVDANTVNTDNESRDSHLREDTYFDVKNYPVIHFVSTKVTGRNGNFSMTGNLTIKATTKSISFPFTAAESGDGFTFKGDFKINRRDYGVGGSSTISDNVEVSLEVATKKN